MFAWSRVTFWSSISPSQWGAFWWIWLRTRSWMPSKVTLTVFGHSRSRNSRKIVLICFLFPIFFWFNILVKIWLILLVSGLHVIDVRTKTIVLLFDSTPAYLTLAWTQLIRLRLEYHVTLIRFSSNAKTLVFMVQVVASTSICQYQYNFHDELIDQLSLVRD